MKWLSGACLTLLTATACASPANVPPEIGYAQSIAAMTATRAYNSVQATQTVVAQSYADAQFNQRLTETAIPPAQTATQQELERVEVANIKARNDISLTMSAFSVAFTETQIALSVIDMQAQQEIAEAQAGQEWQITFGNAAPALCYGAVGIVLFALLVVACFAGYHTERLMHSARQVQENRMWNKAEFERHQREKDSAIERDGQRYYLTTSEHRAVTVAEQHLARAHRWRMACKCLVGQAIILARQNAKHPFSETSLSGFVTQPETGKTWTDGYRRLIGVLKSAEVLASAGPRSAVEWAEGWNAERFAREFDMIHLPNLPEGEPPNVQIPAYSFAEMG